MGRGILLSQYPLAAAAPAVFRDTIRFDDAEHADRGASVGYFRDDGAGPRTPAAPAATPGARYWCRECGDSGAATERYDVLMIVAFNVPPAQFEEVEAWYQAEHVPLLLRAPGWYRARRYHVIRAEGGPPWTHLALHELRDARVLDSRERAYARSTAWRARLEQEPWFRGAGRFIYRRLEDDSGRVSFFPTGD